MQIELYMRKRCLYNKIATLVLDTVSIGAHSLGSLGEAFKRRRVSCYRVCNELRKC